MSVLEIYNLNIAISLISTHQYSSMSIYHKYTINKSNYSGCSHYTIIEYIINEDMYIYIFHFIPLICIYICLYVYRYIMYIVYIYILYIYFLYRYKHYIYILCVNYIYIMCKLYIYIYHYSTIISLVLTFSVISIWHRSFDTPTPSLPPDTSPARSPEPERTKSPS